MCTGITIVIGITGTKIGIIVIGIEMETGIETETEIMIGITIEMTDRTGIDGMINGNTGCPGNRLIPLTRQCQGER